jgi:hypothetical protein
MNGKLLLQVLALCLFWHKQGDGVATAFTAPKPTTASNRAPLALNSYALARWGDGPGSSPSIANELIRGFDRWDEFGYGYGRGSDYNYGPSYGGYGRYGGHGRNNRIPWYCDNDLSSTEGYYDSSYNGSYNRGYGYDRGYNGYYDGGYSRRNNNYYGGRGYYNNNYGYGGGYDRNRNSYFRNGSYNRMMDSFY